jgi:hypothetical protein
MIHWVLLLHFTLNGSIHTVPARTFASQTDCLTAEPMVKNFVVLQPNETLTMDCKTQ